MSCLNSAGASGKTVEEWFDAPKRGGSIAFSVRHKRIQGGKSFVVYLYLALEQDGKQGNTDPSLTRLLSSVYSDEDLGQYLCVVTCPASEAAVRELIGIVAQSTTCPRGEDSVLISYINTDLNDFGRGNDIRESPKDLVKDFTNTMRDRLQVPFDGLGGSLRRLDDLNGILKEVLQYSPIFMKGISSEIAAFEISECAVSSETGDLTFTASRLSDNRDYSSVDFLSAGENECVFVFALILHLPLGGGVLLLDEPDLHLETQRKHAFFAAIYKLVREADCQCVIATHSEHALVGFKDVSYSVIRPIVEQDGKDYIFRYVADSEVDLRLAHSKQLFSQAFKSLRHFGEFSERLVISLWRGARIETGHVSFIVTFMWLLALLFIQMFGFNSDVFLTFFGQSLADHEKFAVWVTRLSLGVSVTFLVYIGWAMYANTKEQRMQRTLINKALEAKKVRLSDSNSH